MQDRNGDAFVINVANPNGGVTYWYVANVILVQLFGSGGRVLELPSSLSDHSATWVFVSPTKVQKLKPSALAKSITGVGSQDCRVGH